MTLLTIVQDAYRRLGLSPAPTTIVGSTDGMVLQMLALANQEGEELARRAAWEVLQKEVTIAATATETQASAIPSDFDRFIDGTFFNRSQNRTVKGPLTPQEWQRQKAVTTSVVFDQFRLRGNDLLILPVPTAGDTLAFEYVSNQWCESSGGTGQNAWAADTDVGRLDEELMTLGLIWRYRQAKRLDYGEEFQTYETQVTQAIGRDGGARHIIDMRRHRKPGYIGVQEGNWVL